MILFIVTIYYYGFITTFLLSFVVVIAKKSRGKKIGKKMMLDAESWAKNMGLKIYDNIYMIPRCFCLMSKDHTVDFYKKCGYVEFDENYMIKEVVDYTDT